MVVNVALMAALVETGLLSPPVAAIASTLAVLIGGYLTLHLWVFKDRDASGGHLTRAPAYYVVMLTGKAANYVLFLGLLAVGVWYPLAWVLGSAVVFVGTFSANRWLWSYSTISLIR